MKDFHGFDGFSWIFVDFLGFSFSASAASILRSASEASGQVSCIYIQETWPLASLADLSMLAALAENENPRKSTKIHENPSNP